jgi:mono/diheme cytochrome c family protein
MCTIRIVAAVVAVSVLLTGAGFAIGAESHYGDAAYGRGLAIRWCSSCHLVTVDQQHSMPGAPSFVTVAQSAEIDGDRLARLLLSPHPKMAKLALSRSAVDDIAAYIASLKK